MNGVRITIGLVFFLQLACAAENEPLEGKLSNNGLVLNLSLLRQLPLEPLSDASATLAGEFDSYLADPQRRELFSYVITCALDEGQELVSSEGQTFSGSLGLAPEWTTRACDLSCQRWLTACLLAHTNEAGQSVAISPRASHSALHWNAAVERSFDYEEAAYFGNAFAESASLQACGGEDFFDGEFSQETGEHFLGGRIVGARAEEVHFLGPCLIDLGVPLPGASAGACLSREAGYYVNCEERAEDENSSTSRYSEVITVFLASSEE